MINDKVSNPGYNEYICYNRASLGQSRLKHSALFQKTQPIQPREFYVGTMRLAKAHLLSIRIPMQVAELLLLIDIIQILQLPQIKIKRKHRQKHWTHFWTISLAQT
jgi:hypothetical protein